MAQHYNPRIVTDGLVMCLDASQNKSYPATDLPVKDGLGLWLDAADDTTFSYSSGTAVSQWRDKSGNNFHASQGTVVSQPSRSTFQNSRKTVNFDGTNDTVTIPNFSCNSEMSLFVVSNCGTSLLIEHSTDANNNQGFYFYGGGTGMIYITRATGTLIYNTNWLSGGYSIASAVNSTGLDLLTYKNGTQQTITTDNRSAVTNSYVTNTLYIGSRGANSLWSSGPIAEIIIYNRKVTNAERNLIHTYLGQKWGILNTDRSIIDLSGNSNNGLLGNGTTADMPLFDYYNKGAIKFDGSSDYLVVADNVVLSPVNVTVSMWLKRNDYQSSICNFLRRNDRDAYALMAVNNTDTVRFRIRNSLAAVVDATTTMPLNTWTNLVGTFDGSNVRIYKDGVLANTAANTSAISYSGSTIGDLIIARDDIVSGRYAPINVGSTLIYNRALSAAEIAQNYEAQKSKFANTIVQQGLVLNLDAGNIYSYAGAGTTWYDVSTSNNNSTLTNGPTYSSDSGGIIIFDGVDDYVNLNSGNAINNWNPDGINASTSYRSYTSANVWFKVSTISTGGVQKMIFSDSFMEYGFSYTNNTLYFIAYAVQSTTIAANTWYNACLVADVGRPGTGNYTQSGTTTITCTTNYPITFVTGNTISIIFTSGTATSGNYVATVTGTYTFTITAASAATTSGGFYYAHSSNTSTVTAYLNGVQIGSPVTANSTNGLNDAPFALGRDGGGVAGSNFAGSIALFQLYSKALSAAEVLQNYNATKGRFGL